MDWFSVFTPAVISTLISGAVSITVALISYRKNKKATQAEIEKMKLSQAHEDKVREEDHRRADDGELRSAMIRVFETMSAYKVAPDGVSQREALSALARAYALADGSLSDSLDALRRSVEKEDPFDGPSAASEACLQQVRINFRK